MPYAAEICSSRFTFSWSDIVNREDKFGLTPLMISAERGSVCWLKVLIVFGAEVDRVTHSTVGFWKPNKPALIRAVNRGQWKCVKALVNAGADVNIALENRITPLMHATYGGHVKCVKLLINAGADVNMTNIYGNASISQIPRYKYKAQIVVMLIKAGADVNAPDLYGQPQILSAARQGTWGLLKLMIESGADVNATDAQNNTALICAADREKTDEIYRCLHLFAPLCFG